MGDWGHLLKESLHFQKAKSWQVLSFSMWSLYFLGCSGPVHSWSPALIPYAALHPAMAPRSVPQTGATHVPEAGASSAAAGFQRSRLHDVKAASEAIASASAEPGAC